MGHGPDSARLRGATSPAGTEFPFTCLPHRLAPPDVDAIDGRRCSIRWSSQRSASSSSRSVRLSCHTIEFVLGTPRTRCSTKRRWTHTEELLPLAAAAAADVDVDEARSPPPQLHDWRLPINTLNLRGFEMTGQIVLLMLLLLLLLFSCT